MEFFDLLNSFDYNLIGNTSGCTLTGLTDHDICNVNPRLGPLGDYGGPTATMPLLSGSPAIDNGSPAEALPTDQRGRARPYGLSSDIGAFESSPPYVIRGQVAGFTLRGEVGLTANLTNTLATQRRAYSFEGLSPGTYTVAPVDTNYLFVPTRRVLDLGPDQVGVDFRAYQWDCLSVESVSSSEVELAFPGPDGQVVRLLHSPDLAGWIPIATNRIPATNLLRFTDVVTANHGFYRAVSQ